MAYIEQEAAISELKSLPEQERLEYMGVYDCIKSVPAADVAEVRHGKWIMRGGKFRCSECDGKALMQDVGGTGGFSHEFEQVKSDFCPHCGAKMDGKDYE